MAGTLGDMISRIQDEMQRTDLETETQLAISQAIAYYQKDAFYLSDAFGNQTLIANQQVYALPSDFAWLREFYITQNGQRYEVRQVSFEYLIAEDTNVTSQTTGSPVDFAILGTVAAGLQAYFFPRPDNNVYVWYYSYVSQIPAPATTTTAGNFWMTSAEAMVRNWSKYLLFNEVLQQPDLAKQFQDRAMEEHLKLRELTAMQKFTGTIQASRF